MSNVQEYKNFPIDMSENEVEYLKKYIESGLPGIIDVTDDKVKQVIEMYMNGESYSAISAKLSIKKAPILYLAYKHNFYEMKMEMLAELVDNAKAKAQMVGLRSVDFLSDVMTGFENYYRDLFNRYRTTKNSALIETAGFENLKTYIKCMETLQKLSNPDEKSEKGGAFNLNIPKGATLKKIDDKTIEVSPLGSESKDSKLKEVLSQLAQLKKLKEEQEQEKKK